MVPQRVANVLLAAAVAIAVLATGARANAAPTGYDVAPEFQTFYLGSGGLSNFGYAISAPKTEGDFLVQYFERQRFENHPENEGTPYQVELGRLGADSAQSSGLFGSAAFQSLPAGTADNGSCTFFAETGHQMCGSFRDYWHQNGVEFGDSGVSMRESLALFGYPISEELQDPTSGLVVQYFERARFEHHPEFSGTKYEVELTLLGDTVLNNQSGRECDGSANHGRTAVEQPALWRLSGWRQRRARVCRASVQRTGHPKPQSASRWFAAECAPVYGVELV